MPTDLQFIFDKEERKALIMCVRLARKTADGIDFCLNDPTVKDFKADVDLAEAAIKESFPEWDEENANT